jgi:(p)ppGpp synthase/HD superfamily hydrolase
MEDERESMAADGVASDGAEPEGRLGAALSYAVEVHRGQFRKGARAIPYIAHPLAVAALVLEYGGDEDEAVAALLHDVPEDGEDGDGHLVTIGERFGPRVRQIVSLCTETTVKPKPPWPKRKRDYVERLRAHVVRDDVEVGYLRVSLADKVHNVGSILADLARGERVFDRFNAPEPKDQNTLRYYQDLADAFAQYEGPDIGVRGLSRLFDAAVRDLAVAVTAPVSRP